MKYALVFEDFSLYLEGKSILQNIHFSLKPCSINVLLGRSGSGKTSVLRSINRLHEEICSSSHLGHVWVTYAQKMQDVYSLHPNDLFFLRQKVAMLFQTPQLFPLSIQKNMLLPLRYMTSISKKQAKEKMCEALEQVGLYEEVSARLNEPASSLSGGQQQRLCLARILALEPEILLLDEPTASLDVAAAKTIETLLPKLAERYTIFMVSHSLEQAARLADQILFCQNGQITKTFDREHMPNKLELHQMLDPSALA